MTTTAITLHPPLVESSSEDHPSGAIEPSVLLTEEDAERVARAVEEALAPASRRAYASALRTYKSWLLAREGGGSAPLQPSAIYSPQIVASYLTSLAQNCSPSTVETARAAIIHAAKDHRLAASLRSNEGLRMSMQGLRRQARGYTPRKAPAMTVSHIRRMLNASSDDLTGRRNRALILIGVSLGTRGSELVGVTLDKVTFIEGRGAEIVIPFSKTSSTPVTLALAALDQPHADLCPVRALKEYLRVRSALSDHKELPSAAPLFTTIRRGGWNAGGPLSAEAISPILRGMASAAGIEDVVFTSHSLRATYATLAMEAGVPEREVMRDRWRSAATVRSYNRADSWRQPSSAWLGLI